MNRHPSLSRDPVAADDAGRVGMVDGQVTRAEAQRASAETGGAGALRTPVETAGQMAQGMGVATATDGSLHAVASDGAETASQQIPRLCPQPSRATPQAAPLQPQASPASPQTPPLQPNPPRPRPQASTTRDARLKAALRANLGRRKAQARSRDAAEDTTGDAPEHHAPHTNTRAPENAPPEN